MYRGSADPTEMVLQAREEQAAKNSKLQKTGLPAEHSDKVAGGRMCFSGTIGGTSEERNKLSLAQRYQAYRVGRLCLLNDISDAGSGVQLACLLTAPHFTTADMDIFDIEDVLPCLQAERKQAKSESKPKAPQSEQMNPAPTAAPPGATGISLT